MVLLVLAVVSPKLGKRLLKHTAVARILGGHKALNQLEHAVSHLVAVLVDGKRRPAVRLAGMVAGGRRVLERVEDGAVKVKDHGGKSCHRYAPIYIAHANGNHNSACRPAGNGRVKSPAGAFGPLNLVGGFGSSAAWWR